MTTLAWAEQDATTWADLDGTPWCGVIHLPGILDGSIVVEFAWGADLADPDSWRWYDETHNVRQADGQRIVISPMGRSDETTQAQPAGCAFQLDNSSGEYSTYNAARGGFPSSWRNTPVRVIANTGSASVRFQGYLNGLPPTWDTSGKLAIVSVSASGELRRLGQGKRKLRSAPYRYLTKLTGTKPVAAWPLEGGRLISGGDALYGTQSLRPFVGTHPSGAVISYPQWGNGTLGPWLPQVVSRSNSGGLTALWAQVSMPGFSTTWSVDLAYASGSDSTGDDAASVIDINPSYLGGAGSWPQLEFFPSSGRVAVTFNGAPESFSATPGLYDGLAHHVRWTATQTGGDVVWHVYIDSVDYNAGTAHSFDLPPITAISLVTSGGSGQVAQGYVSVWTTAQPVADMTAAILGYPGENVIDRLNRLSAEELTRINITGTSRTAMGPQGLDTLLGHYRECEAVELGLLYDGRGPEVGFITRAARYDPAVALTVDMAAGQVAPPFSPADDDQRSRNLWSYSRKDGVQGITYEDVNGPLGTVRIGTYDDAATINSFRDAVLSDYAHWSVHAGTMEGYRYPTLNLDLAATPEKAADWTDTPLSGRIDVLNPAQVAPQHPVDDVPLILEGYSEQLSPFGWKVAATCSTGRTWDVNVMGRSRVDTLHSFTAFDVAAGATSFLVMTDSGHKLWTPGAGLDYYVVVNGVKIHVTGIAGASSPQTFTVGALSGPLLAGSRVRIWHPSYVAF